MYTFFRLKEWLFRNSKFVLGVTLIFLAIFEHYYRNAHVKATIFLFMGIIYLVYGFYLRRRVSR